MLEAGAIQHMVTDTLNDNQNTISRSDHVIVLLECSIASYWEKRATTLGQDRFLQFSTRNEPNLTAMQQVQRPDHAPAVSKRSINILAGNTHSVLITD